jgi:putative spermidine/putrescine transport system ATP-binding protein
MARLELRDLSKRYGDHYAVRSVNLEVPDGEFLVLLGPSGCGKTTTLRMIAGFIEPTGGVVRIGGAEVTYLPPWRRNTGMVFQSYALFPHMTVAENVAFGLEMRKLDRPELAARSAEALRLVRLEGFSARLPRQLSGGQQQRVALARALAIRPEVLLLDEPLSNLDAKLREEVRIEIRELQRQLGLTTVMVTHDQEEALTVADRLVVMADGEIRQIGSQRDLYERPADRFVAGFVGRSTFLEGRVAAPGEFETAGGLRLKCLTDGVSGPAALALRPERLSLGPGPPLDNRLPGGVEFVSYLGAVLELHVRLSPADRVVVQLPNRGEATMPAVGDTVEVGWPRDAGLVFAGQGNPGAAEERT